MVSRAEEPCRAYVGNVCSGFGGECVCMLCGWDLLDHPERKERARDAFARQKDAR